MIYNVLYYFVTSVGHAVMYPLMPVVGHWLLLIFSLISLTRVSFLSIRISINFIDYYKEAPFGLFSPVA